MVNTKSAVFLFIGSDEYSKEKAIRDLGASVLDKQSKEFDYKVFSCAETQARDILDYILTVPLLAQKRFVVVKDFDEASDEDKIRIANYVKNPVKTAYLVIDVKDDSAIRKYPALVQHAAVTRFGEMSDAQFQSWIKERLSSGPRSKKITPDAARSLRELYGNDLNLLSQELEKVVSFADDKDEIALADIDEVAGKNINTSAFELTDAIEKGDIKEALTIVSDLALAGKKHYEVIGLLCWQMKRLLRAKMLSLKGASAQEISSLLKINSYYYGRFAKQLKALELPQIKANMKVLLEADLDIKRTRYDPALALEFCVIKLCLGASR